MKFCGLTRAEDAAEAERLGAGYLGVIFAGGPRNLTEGRARDVFGPQHRVRRVGVFSSANEATLDHLPSSLALDVLQIHGDAKPAEVESLRNRTGLDVWSVLRIAGSKLPDNAREMFDVSSGVVLDTRVEGVLGGTGTKFDWANVARRLERIRAGARVILAGGLNPTNVVDAIAALSPDIVDVSSGVETSPGIKDHQLMARFASATRGSKLPQ